MVKPGDKFYVAVKYPDSNEMFKSSDVDKSTWSDAESVNEFLVYYLNREARPEPGTVIAFTLAGTDNVFIYKIGMRAELKGKAIFVDSTGTPAVVKERTRMPSPDKVKMVNGDKYREGEGEGVIRWRYWEEFSTYPGTTGITVQAFADAGIRSYYPHYQIQTAYGTYTFKRGRQGAVAGKAIHVRENPEY
jgi:hypothetical protein